MSEENPQYQLHEDEWHCDPLEVKTKFRLTEQQVRFVMEYCVHFNALRAYWAAGYTTVNKSPKHKAAKVMRSDRVKDAIRYVQKHDPYAGAVTRDRIAAELAKIAFSNKKDFARWGPEGVILTPSEELSRAETASVSDITVQNTKFGQSVTLKHFDKMKALDMLCKYTNMYGAADETDDGQPQRTLRVQFVDSENKPTTVDLSTSETKTKADDGS